MPINMTIIRCQGLLSRLKIQEGMLAAALPCSEGPVQSFLLRLVRSPRFAADSMTCQASQVTHMGCCGLASVEWKLNIEHQV